MKFPDDYHRTFENGYRLDWLCAGTVASSDHADLDGMFLRMGWYEVDENFEARNIHGEEVSLRFFRCNRGVPEVELDPDELLPLWLESEGYQESRRLRALSPKERRERDERLRLRGCELARKAM